MRGDVGLVRETMEGEGLTHSLVASGDSLVLGVM
jgi:hypothetical protein